MQSMSISGLILSLLAVSTYAHFLKIEGTFGTYPEKSPINFCDPGSEPYLKMLNDVSAALAADPVYDIRNLRIDFCQEHEHDDVYRDRMSAHYVFTILGFGALAISSIFVYWKNGELAQKTEAKERAERKAGYVALSEKIRDQKANQS
mmetsp:Transcript_37911/g.38599  ORF Transcript_37911/g.38599 Transcript_37911/m.38599 type:complete len:148 (+) Transcript_37911:89-532(+)|eukprot:CAMPEP_0182426700 /NCGR_PEP_ID=MMETSP1167-20130531/13224_1 /TAXON_ID=2988 /ORGANISM="Mallomonas Sp, Strain CCMP3275" /LENGTH=147 /DNA_ID=CAMNT_0024608343 /DNA_START=88 /DNA_END=531 /DNA_ORIENTATION=+